MPPSVKDETWDLQDRGQWAKDSKFPVFALPGAEGARIMRKLGQYSGKSSDPFLADILAKEQLEPSDCVRLYAKFAIGELRVPTNLIITLSVLCGIFLIVSILCLFKCCIQFRRRRGLQRRLATGNEDLVRPDVMTQHLAQAVVKSLPTTIFSQDVIDEDSSNFEDTATDSPANRLPIQAITPATAPRQAQPNQAICPICRDDYFSGVTRIKRLPCGHSYHPWCIAQSVRRVSPRCPVCNATVLPSDPSSYSSVPVTNAMVRVDRRNRRNSGRGRRVNPPSHFRRVFRRSAAEAAAMASTRPVSSPIEMAPLDNRSITSNRHNPASSGEATGAQSSLGHAGSNEGVEGPS